MYVLGTSRSSSFVYCVTSIKPAKLSKANPKNNINTATPETRDQTLFQFLHASEKKSHPLCSPWYARLFLFLYFSDIAPGEHMEYMFTLVWAPWRRFTFIPVHFPENFVYRTQAFRLHVNLCWPYRHGCDSTTVLTMTLRWPGGFPLSAKELLFAIKRQPSAYGPRTMKESSVN